MRYMRILGVYIPSSPQGRLIRARSASLQFLRFYKPWSRGPMSPSIPRFAWRVTSSRSRYSGIMSFDAAGVGTKLFTMEQLRQVISAHMQNKYYKTPCAIVLLTGSLLCALNYAHWLVRNHNETARLHLIDSWLIPEKSVFAARFLARYVALDSLSIPWHENPYHKYFAFNGMPHYEMLGLVEIWPVIRNELDCLLPTFSQTKVFFGALNVFIRLGLHGLTAQTMQPK